MAASRYGSDLVRAQPVGYRVPAPVGAGESIGANTLVGVDPADGQLKQVVDGTVYTAILYAREEIEGGDADGDVVAKEDVAAGMHVKLSGAGFAQTDLGATVYAEDHQTVNLADGAGTRAVVGRITEVVDANNVYVRLTNPA